MSAKNDVRKFFSEHELSGSSVIIAVSGGIDSTVLLHTLLELEGELDLELVVAHLDHGLRGESSRADAEFVREKCESLGLEARIERRPVREESESSSIEEAARSVRYDFLAEVANEEGGDYVALGHNRNDQAETVLMHLIRGAGLGGLAGMKEIQGRYIRPLLKTSRAEIRECARKNELGFRVDETNRDTDYLRNRIRHELIPELRENYNRKVIENLVTTASLAGEAGDYLEERAHEVMSRIRKERPDRGICFDRYELLDHHPYLQKEALRLLIKRAKGDLKDVTSDHVEAILEKIETEPARSRLDLPSLTFTLERSRGCFRKDFSPATSENFCYYVEVGSSVTIAEAELEIDFELKEREGESLDDYRTDRLIECVDWSKVEQPIFLRNRQAGDRFVPLGMSGEKKLKDFFIDEKVPYGSRDRVPLLEDKRGIIWVVGYRIDDRYKVSRETKTIMKMKARRI